MSNEAKCLKCGHGEGVTVGNLCVVCEKGGRWCFCTFAPAQPDTRSQAQGSERVAAESEVETTDEYLESVAASVAIGFCHPQPRETLQWAIFSALKATRNNALAASPSLSGAQGELKEIQECDKCDLCEDHHE